MSKAAALPLTTPVFVCTIPKSGTLLLGGILRQIFGKELMYKSADKYGNRHITTEVDILSQHRLENKIYSGHIRYSEKIANLISKYPKVFLIRDPRDYVVSQAHFMNNFKRESTIERRYRALPSWKLKLSAVIFGMTHKAARLEGVNEFYNVHCIKFLSLPNTFVVKFEDIVGSQSGGNDNRALTTIRSILEFIGCTINDAETLADDVYLGSDPAKSSTFRSGKIGSWRQEFNADHVKQFKLVAPGLVSGLGYEKDESWDLYSSGQRANTAESNIGPIYEMQKENGQKINKYNLQMFNYFNSDISSLDARYQELLSGSETHPLELFEFLHTWSFRNFFKMKEYQKALSILDKLLSNNPREPEWNYYKAFCLQHIGQDLNEAVKHYTMALENGYKEFWVRYNRSILYRNLGDLEKAQTDIQRAISIEPGHEGASKILSEIQEAELKEHHKSTPTIFEENIPRIRDLIDNNEFQKATLLLDESLKKFPANAELNYLYGFC
ncbi:MAG: sulfotransferase domain-containing protein, partial [Thermoproteota archaeon]|nr:sulfotransferase domain-containing protein [Thermoproteota archaeon]